MAQSRTWQGFITLLIVLAAPFMAHAQGHAVDWFKIAGGGGASAGGVYSVNGTIGQPDASGPLTNGLYSLVGGFWALPVLVQMPGAPTLHITNGAPGFATIWWTPPTPGFTLQSTHTLSPTQWIKAPSGAANPATVPATLPSKFYRLVAAPGVGANYHAYKTDFLQTARAPGGGGCDWSSAFCGSGRPITTRERPPLVSARLHSGTAPRKLKTHLVPQ